MLNFKDWLIENEDKKRRVNIGKNSRTPARPEILAMKESSSESEVLFLYNNDENLEKIKKETGRSVGDIYRILKKNQISPSRTKKKHGLIKYFSDSGYDISDIAIKVDMSNQSVKNAMKQQ